MFVETKTNCRALDLVSPLDHRNKYFGSQNSLHYKIIKIQQLALYNRPP